MNCSRREPGGEFLAAFGVAGVEARAGPFVSQGAVESSQFAIGLRLREVGGVGCDGV
jgi:hypothetical protein